VPGGLELTVDGEEFGVGEIPEGGMAYLSKTRKTWLVDFF
jgi:hypothetical protein